MSKDLTISSAKLPEELFESSWSCPNLSDAVADGSVSLPPPTTRNAEASFASKFRGMQRKLPNNQERTRKHEQITREDLLHALTVIQEIPDEAAKVLS